MRYLFYRVYAPNNDDNVFYDYEIYIQNVIEIPDEFSRDDMKDLLKSRHTDVKYFRRPKKEQAMYFGKFFETTKSHYESEKSRIDFDCVICGKHVDTQGLYSKKMFTYETCSKECLCKLNRIKDQINGEKYDNDFYVDKEKEYKVNTGYIYRIYNKETDKSYIGQSIYPPIFRWWDHISNKLLHEYDDLNELTFEVLETVRDEKIKDKLFEREQFYIDKYNSIELGYNSIRARKG